MAVGDSRAFRRSRSALSLGESLRGRITRARLAPRRLANAQFSVWRDWCVESRLPDRSGLRPISMVGGTIRDLPRDAPILGPVVDDPVCDWRVGRATWHWPWRDRARREESSLAGSGSEPRAEMDARWTFLRACRREC